MNRLPPYDTGKVKIGLYYEPPREQYMSRDAELLQSALLKPAPRFNSLRQQERAVIIKDAIMWLAGCAVLVAMMFAPSLYKLFTGT